MLRLTLLTAVLLVGCGDDDCCTGSPDAAQLDAAVIRPDTLDICPGPGRDKIKFTREHSCANDGGVEWCIPETDTQLKATLSAISPTISCAPGGGRAGCNSTGLLLCSYPTHYPDQCLASWGEMKPEVWDDICEVAAQSAITEIVPTILE